jgi:hypothetical protein
MKSWQDCIKKVKKSMPGKPLSEILKVASVQWRKIRGAVKTTVKKRRKSARMTKKRHGRKRKTRRRKGTRRRLKGGMCGITAPGTLTPTRLSFATMSLFSHSRRFPSFFYSSFYCSTYLTPLNTGNL